MSLLISPNALTELISIGKHEQFELLADIPERYPELKSGLRLSSTTGKQLLDRLSSNEIVHLCKALTIGENIHSSWMYGSVSPVIWLYHVLDSRTDWKRVEVTNWLLSHTNNPYVPFTNHGAVSIEEYEQVKRRLSDQKKTNQQFIQPQLKLHLDFLESELAQRAWFAGAQFSAADIQMSFPLEAAAARGGLDQRYPNLTDFLARIHARPAYQRALAQGGEFNLG